LSVHEPLVVVGSGVLGLCSAWEAARAGRRVVIVSSPRAPRASEAAAADLALHGQRYARAAHFELKLRMREAYPDWITELEAASGLRVPFVRGEGIAIFADASARDAHESRIRQSEEILKARNLPSQGIEHREVAGLPALTCADESWVDAHALLTALTRAAIASGVTFVSGHLASRDDLVSYSGASRFDVLLCAGAGSLELLESLGLWPCGGPQRARLSSPRFSVGTVLASSRVEPWPQYALVEVPGGATLAGDARRVFASSSTVRVGVTSIHGLSTQELEEWRNEDDALRASADAGMALLGELLREVQLERESLERAKIAATPEPLEWEERRGLRLGFGHGELLACELEGREAPWAPGRAYLFAGAHKSGYLFGPAAGAILREMGVLACP
jgi:glycine/D-amino acid oxidase-like deaminating enzyme